MSAQDLEQRARELLAAESRGRREADTMLGPDVASEAAIRAIAAALRQQPAPVDLEDFRLAVEALKVVGNALKQPDLIAEYDRLLSIIDNAGKVEDAEAEFADWLAKEMPAGTVIGDPAWWANRIARQYSKRARQPAPVVEAGGWIAADDVRRLTREIDIALNGEAGAAPQASLCDIAAQVKAEASKRGAPLLAAPVVDDAMRELIQKAREMVEAVRAIPESELLALDSDPHPPSSLSVAADDLEAALARAQGVQS